jgi:RNA polymerase sigma-70 factor (ECF subfamily)
LVFAALGVMFSLVRRTTDYAATEQIPERLVTRSMAGHEDEFLELLERHKTILFKIANLYCRNRADFADVVQEITFQAWRSFARYDRSRPFSTWMYRIGLNVAISFYRTEARRSRLMVPTDESVILKSLRLRLKSRSWKSDFDCCKFISQFGEFDKALVLLYLDGHSHEAIGDILGISVSNVSTRINRIKQKLRRKWGGSLEEGILAWTSMI